MKFNKINHFILFGGGPLLLSIADWVKKEKLSLHVYTSPRHVEEPMSFGGPTFGESLTARGIAFVSTEDINKEQALRSQITSQSLGLGMGEAWSFDADIIDRFSGRLLDFMGIPHPRYRGGAHYTWMILRGEKEGASNLQVINTDMVQGEFDSGELVKTRTYKWPASARIPQDYFDFAVKQDTSFLLEFLREAKAGKDFKLQKPNEARSLFLPRLNTMKQGWIDWSWSGNDIERFIRAFDDPYKGASTRISSKRVYLKGARLLKDEKIFHPFQSGIITRLNGDVVTVATTAGHLQIGRVLSEDGALLNGQLRLGQRFFTPSKDREEAFLYEASYGATK